MKANYFPPKEDVILMNEAPTDFYVLVSGAVVGIFLNVTESKISELLGGSLYFFCRMCLQTENCNKEL